MRRNQKEKNEESSKSTTYYDLLRKLQPEAQEMNCLDSCALSCGWHAQVPATVEGSRGGQGGRTEAQQMLKKDEVETNEMLRIPDN